MNDKDKKVVNTEEQNRTVNPGDKDYNEGESTREQKQDQKTITKNDQAEVENPDGGSEIERPHQIEGDDADGIERKVPNL